MKTKDKRIKEWDDMLRMSVSMIDDLLRLDRPDPLTNSAAYWEWVFRNERKCNTNLNTDMDRQEILITETVGNRVDFTFAVQGELSAEEMIKEMITKYPKLKSMEITLNGKRYKVQAIDELTLEDCVRDNRCVYKSSGETLFNHGKSLPFLNYDVYPTESIAYKVLLYGLLQSVAHKLNGGKTGEWALNITNGAIGVQEILCGSFYDVTFATKELAEEAIRIFRASKFDLKKLFQ